MDTVDTTEDLVHEIKREIDRHMTLAVYGREGASRGEVAARSIAACFSVAGWLAMRLDLTKESFLDAAGSSFDEVREAIIGAMKQEVKHEQA